MTLLLGFLFSNRHLQDLSIVIVPQVFRFLRGCRHSCIENYASRAAGAAFALGQQGHGLSLSSMLMSSELPGAHQRQICQHDTSGYPYGSYFEGGQLGCPFYFRVTGPVSCWPSPGLQHEKEFHQCPALYAFPDLEVLAAVPALWPSGQKLAGLDFRWTHFMFLHLTSACIACHSLQCLQSS